MNQRTALGDMLQQLLKQKDQREQELRQVLVRKMRFSSSRMAATIVGDSVCDGALRHCVGSCCSPVSPLLCSAGGDGGEVRLHPAELLDDSIPEAAGCQAAVSADAGTAAWLAQRAFLAFY